MTETKKYQCNEEDLPFIAAYLIISLKRDKLLFKAQSKAFSEEFITNFEAQKTVIDKLISPSHLLGERKVITKLVSEDRRKIRVMVNNVEVFLKMTSAPLTVAASDFGIAALRVELKAKNDEGIVSKLKILFKNVEDNKVALEPAGYTPEISTEFTDLLNSLTTNSIAQNLKFDSRINLTQENIKKMNELWQYMDKVMYAGKKIAYAKNDDLLLKDYTYIDLEKKVRLERPPLPPQDKP